MTDGIELSNNDKIRTLGEKEANTYFGILEADPAKQVEINLEVPVVEWLSS